MHLLPGLTELRLAAFKRHRGRTLALSPVTLLAGAPGSGRASALEACTVLARLAGGETLAESFAPIPGGAPACVPRSAKPDSEGRRGLRIGCSARGPLGEVRLDVAVQVEPELRVVGERLTAAGEQLFSTALRDPGRRRVQASWRTAGLVRVTRAPLPDDRLGTALLPLRVAGRTEGERLVLRAAEQVVVALRSLFSCEPQPAAMRAPVRADGAALRRDCGNLAAVLNRVRAECATRHAALVAAVREGCGGPLRDLLAEELPDGTVRAMLDRGGEHGSRALDTLTDGELRYLGLSLVFLTGPGVLEVEPAAEVPAALTVLAGGLDRALDAGQCATLVGLAGAMAARGHVRLLASVDPPGDAGAVRAGEGIAMVDLGA
ncbi:ATP-binding protein [Streptomyces polyrhachis]|uniref:ATP-binding protein n=1 Tax=Streptomyces polyrhachis TaxID=1282885 RepID=A0ABW2GHP8_9ACTN